MIASIIACDRKGAWEALCRIAGVEPSSVIKKSHAIQKRGNVAYHRQVDPIQCLLDTRVQRIDALREYFTYRLRRCRRLLAERRMSLRDFYIVEDYCHYRLLLLDSEYAVANYELHQYKRIV